MLGFLGWAAVFYWCTDVEYLLDFAFVVFEHSQLSHFMSSCCSHPAASHPSWEAFVYICNLNKFCWNLGWLGVYWFKIMNSWSLDTPHLRCQWLFIHQGLKPYTICGCCQGFSFAFIEKWETAAYFSEMQWFRDHTGFSHFCVLQQEMIFNYFSFKI